MGPGGHGPGAQASPARTRTFDFFCGPGRAIFDHPCKFAARGANRRLIWSREGPNQAIFENPYFGQPVNSRARPLVNQATHQSGPRHVADHMWLTTSGTQHVANDMWPTICGRRHVGDDKWPTTCGQLPVSCLYMFHNMFVTRTQQFLHLRSISVARCKIDP